MPQMPAQLGGPTDFGKSMTPVMLAILVLQTMGGFIMAIAIGLGWYAWKQDMNITFICYWGMMSLFNGVMDLVKLIDYQVKSPMPLFSGEAPAMYNVASCVQLAIPFSALGGCVLAWYLYKDATASPGSESSSFLTRAPSGRGAPAASVLGQRSQPQFKTFGGQGARLG